MRLRGAVILGIPDTGTLPYAARRPSAKRGTGRGVGNVERARAVGVGDIEALDGEEVHLKVFAAEGDIGVRTDLPVRHTKPQRLVKLCDLVDRAAGQLGDGHLVGHAKAPLLIEVD